MAERVHELKTWPSYFEAVARGEKRHEIRSSRDRDFAVGDVLLLREWDPELHRRSAYNGEHTGRSLRVRVTYVSPGGQFGLAPDHVVMSIALEADRG